MLRIRPQFRLLALVAVLFTAACATQPAPSVTYPQMTWRHLQPTSFQAASVDIIDESAARGGDGLTVDLPVDALQQMRNWGTGRINAVGGPATLRFIITDARAAEDPLERDKGIVGFLTDQNEAKVTLRLSARLEVRGPGGELWGETRAGATRSTTVKESLSLVEREALLYDLLERGMQDFNREMSAQIETHLGEFTRR